MAEHSANYEDKQENLDDLRESCDDNTQENNLDDLREYCDDNTQENNLDGLREYCDNNKQENNLDDLRESYDDNTQENNLDDLRESCDENTQENNLDDLREYCDNNTQENIDDLRESCEFSKKTWREDMALVVENRKLFVAGNILALVSPVFLAKLEETFKEGVPKEIVLHDKGYDDIVEFLRCVYPNILKPISLQNVSKMLPLAAEYKVQCLIERCEKYLIDVTNTKTPADVLCKYLLEASSFGLEDLIKHCIQLASVLPIDWLRNAEKDYPLPGEISLEIREQVIDRLNKSNSTRGRIRRSLCDF